MARAPGSLIAFFFLTYVVTWTSWLVAWAISGGGGFAGPPRLGLWMPFFYLGVFAPAFAALWLTSRREGREAARALFRRVFQWRVGLRWYVFALTYFAAIKLVAATIHRLTTGEWPRFSSVPWYVMVAGIVISTPVQAGEEIGWRGYALPRLAARFGLAGASIVIGIFWAAWHLPLFFISGTDKTGQSFPLYLLAVTALSVAIAWLYAHTNGSLLLTMIMHAAINNTNIVSSAEQTGKNSFDLSTSVVAWLSAGLLWICAGYFLVRMRGWRNLS